MTGALASSMLLMHRGAFGQEPVEESADFAAQLAEDVDDLPLLDALPAGYARGLSARTGALSFNYGAVQPSAFVREIATAIMQSAPVNCRPIDVAYYFNNLRMKQVPAVLATRLAAICQRHGQNAKANANFYSTFAYDWEQSQYFNPVVIQFFRGVGLTASLGDNTAWCAAFANWCIARARSTSAASLSFNNSLIQLGTKSASSGSFRCWANMAAAAPIEGDIVVFASAGTAGQRCGLATGHVGFLSRLETRADGAKVLHVIGGNQGYSGSGPAAESGGGGVGSTCEAVSIRRFGRSSGNLRLHAIRTAAFLR